MLHPARHPGRAPLPAPAPAAPARPLGERGARTGGDGGALLLHTARLRGAPAAAGQGGQAGLAQQRWYPPTLTCVRLYNTAGLITPVSFDGCSPYQTPADSPADSPSRLARYCCLSVAGVTPPLQTPRCAAGAAAASLALPPRQAPLPPHLRLALQPQPQHGLSPPPAPARPVPGTNTRHTFIEPAKCLSTASAKKIRNP